MLKFIGDFKGYLVGVAVVLPLVGFLVWQNSRQQESIEFYTALIQQKEITLRAKDVYNQELSNTMNEWEESQRQLVEAIEKLRVVSIESNTETRRLTDVFSKHNMAKLAAKKPSLIEERINSGTVIAFRMLRCASGATDRNCSSGDKTPSGDSHNPRAGTDRD